MLMKVPPHNIEAEQSVLGALLIDCDAVIKIAEKLKPADFYRGKHQEIYASILNLYERREPADLVTVSDELRDRKRLEKVGGDAYLSSLVNMVPTSAHVESYAQIVKGNATRRQLISMAAQVTEKAFSGEVELSELLNMAEREVFAVSQKHLTRNFVLIKEALADSFDRLEELHKKKKKLRGIPTGFKDVDNILAGLQDNNLIVLAARPSVGKTSLALNFAQYITVHEKIPVGFFSLESSKEELVDRLLASQADINAWKITTGNLSEDDFKKLGDAYGILGDAPFFIDDTPGLKVAEMRTKARRLQLEHGVQLIIVDYMQLAVSRNLENRVQEVSEISQGLKNLARELKCPVLALSQLSRAVESRGSNKPQLSDLRDSGSIEQDADVVMFLYRAGEEDDEKAGKGLGEHIRVSIAKHRNGPTGELDLMFKGSRTRFYGMEKKKTKV
ncbi:replicative DNA helicase [Patescibacteria group bacterium]|nr:replicative DNA helicase [Patescibacteria group bacterium]MBU1867848.1 replicative DNA helicase [Patescibacteria group bacterium]